MPALASPRFAWIDNLRTLLIAFVVSVHACVTYSHVGGWYFKEGVEPSLTVKLPFLLWEAHLQSFFMGLLFFVSGYFAELSLARKTTAKFIGERLVRLGIPLLLYVFVIHPVMVWGINPWGAKFPPFGEWYAQYLRSGDFVSSTGPLWFAEALLIFCFAFAAVRKPSPTAAAATPIPEVSVRWRAVLALMLGLGLVSFLVRTVQPIGTSVLNLQLCFFPQYLVAFPLGAWLARRRGLVDVARAPLSRRVGWLTLLISPWVLVGLIAGVAKGGYAGHGEPPLFGGWNFFAVGYAFWEQCAGVGLSLGLMALAYAKMNRETALTRWMADRSFAVYVLHSPILLALTTFSRGLSTNPFLMATYATVVTLVLSFIAAGLVRKIPGLNRVL